jgi:site-specific recombinase XerD
VARMKLDREAVAYLFGQYLAGRSCSPNTIARYLREVRDFLLWAGSRRGKEDLREIGKEDLIAYGREIAAARKQGKPRYSPCTRRGIMSTLFTLFRYCTRNEYILSNPFDGLDLRIMRTYRARDSIPEGRMHRFLDGIRGGGVVALRDRALFELMYGTGMRVSEAAGLDVTDVDMNAGKAFIRQGKGKKDRVVPLGESVLEPLRRYLSKARPLLLRKVTDPHQAGQALFLTLKGRRISVANIEWELKKYFRELGSGARVYPHLLRHSFATHMLEHGARLKEVKEILGHASLQTTVAYTHFSAAGLKRILKRYHPRENDLYEECRLTEGELRKLLRGESGAL